MSQAIAQYKKFREEKVEFDFETIYGAEKLTLGESLSFFFKSTHNFIRSIYITFRLNIHKVNGDRVISKLQRNPVLFSQVSPIKTVAPTGFNQNFPGWSEHYMKKLSVTPFLIDTLKTETGLMYDRIKGFIKTNRFSSRFSWSVSSTDRMLTDAEKFLEELESNEGVIELGVQYRNVAELNDVYSGFNNYAKLIKAKDAEMLSLNLDKLYELTNLLIAKSKEGDVNILENDIRTLSDDFATFKRLVEVTGAYIGLTNEFSAVLKTQFEEINNVIK